MPSISYRISSSFPFPAELSPHGDATSQRALAAATVCLRVSRAPCCGLQPSSRSAREELNEQGAANGLDPGGLGRQKGKAGHRLRGGAVVVDELERHTWTFSQPCAAGSKGRRAMPITRPTCNDADAALGAARAPVEIRRPRMMSVD